MIFPAVVAFYAAIGVWQFVTIGSGWWIVQAMAFLYVAGALMIEIDNERE